MKKTFLSPFFTPIAFLMIWGSFLAAVLIYIPELKFEITKDGNLIDIITYSGYGILIAGLLYFVRDYKNSKSSMIDWALYLLLSICAVTREAGIQHHLSTTDTTPFKSKFYLNPNNPWSEKIIFGLVLIIFFGIIIYLAVKYTKYLITSFFKMNTITWSTAVFCTTLVFCKFADRYPSNYRHSHATPLPQESIEMWSLLEESSEVFLPYIALIMLWQYHLLKKK